MINGFNRGIVGLPNVGKSTLFNAITKAGALAANYPFATSKRRYRRGASTEMVKPKNYSYNF